MYKNFRTAGPLAPVIAFFGFALIIFLTSRVTLLTLYWDRISAVDSFWMIFPLGLRMDVVFLSLLVFIPTLLLMLLPSRAIRALAPLLAAFFAVLSAAVVYMEVATIPFVEQYDSRPNRIFVDYLMYPREVFGTLWADYKVAIFVAAIFVGTTLYFAWKVGLRLCREHQPWSFKKRVVLLPLLMLVLALGARSSLGVRPANISTAAFSNNHLANQLALNSSYSATYALYRRGNEADSRRFYGKMDEEEIVQRVRAQSLIPLDTFTHEDIPTLHTQTPNTKRTRPYNLVIFLQESLGAEYVGSLGGPNLTPNLDALGQQGLWMTQLYSTGTRTVRGIEATTTGFMPSPSRSVVTLDLAQHNFFTIAELLRRQGFLTEFIYGGARHFDNMAGFFLGNGFERTITEEDFDNPVFQSTWGVSDEDLVRRANEEFVAHGDKPFFALMLSTSNHAPFEYPQGRIELHDKQPNTVNNAMKYADYAIGEFFRLAQQEDYYKNTIFMVVADHNTRVFGADLVPINKFHIPGVILGPGVPVQSYDKLSSQLDLLPTLLNLIGVESQHPMLGRDLLNLPESEPGLAIMQYGSTHAYRVADDVIIQQPYKAPQQFRYENGRLNPRALDEAFAKDALAHVLLPSLLYREQRYRLPSEE
jgi:phosphoglycerol transferase MdoB-like AlkP superfamily enzyme